MRLTAALWFRAPLLAFFCLVLRLQMLLPRPFRALGKKRGKRRYSAVTAVYNAGHWLPAYFTSLLCQTLDPETCLEIICVDDGSTDNSAALIQQWQRRYPNLIACIRKKNGGAAAARNLGLEHASGEWVTFIDADDFVHPGYFAAVDRFLDKPAEQPVGMLVCNYLKYLNRKGVYCNSHRLRYRFDRGERRIPADDTGAFVQVVTNSAFFLRRVLMEKGIRQKEDVRPTFEDGEMIMRYVPAIAGMSVGVLPLARYYHRQFDEPFSLTGLAYRSAAYYDAPLALGCLRPLREMAAAGPVPLFAQMTVLYNISRYFQRVLGDAPVFRQLEEKARNRFFSHVREILAYITPEAIEKADFPSAHPSFTELALSLYKKRAPVKRRIFIERYDARNHALRLFFYSASPHDGVNFFCGQTPLTPLCGKATALPTWGQGEFYEHIRWLALPPGDGVLHADERTEFFLASDRQRLDGNATSESVITRLAARDLSSLAWDEALRVRLATSWPMRRLLGRVWLFTDRDVEADDNAEHLYRHVLRRHPETPSYFILRGNSPDWPRLKAEGFRLVPFGSLRHQILLLNCERLISSHYGQPTFFLPQAILRCAYVCLGHGVTRGDNAKNTNALPVAFRPMATRREREYVTANGSPFRLTGKEAHLAGMPRFDALFRMAGHEPERRILFMPTWRKRLTGASGAESYVRPAKEGFEHSVYARTIWAFLKSERLAELLVSHQYRLDFFPHFDMRRHFQGKAFPEGISLAERAGGRSIQEFFRRSRIVVTDYSSIAFDAAFLGRALIYWQFDQNDEGGGDHYAKGYFDYERDGFGPVVETPEQLLDALEDLLRKNGEREAKYSERAEKTFCFRDDGSCERVYAAIAGL
ncbi:MAG: CDP-glycerol:glycerophosphate glycerophosphotransferase [Desulfovibrio sp.]|jgi:glycosyltransferase involved in cell wall biosynthesis|nr:CDP-glycerol:glycerophosphate glycerophosphotransferase [Desulfovibrio sp.]